MVKKRKKVSKKFIPQANIVSDEIYLPNYSGEHTAGTTGTPINDRDIVNKKFLDDNYYDGSEFNAGSVLFSDGTNITQDNFNLYWDDAINELQPNLLKITSDGSQASPALKFNDTNTGFYKSGDSVRFSLNNNTRMTIAATIVGIKDNLGIGEESTTDGSLKIYSSTDNDWVDIKHDTAQLLTFDWLGTSVGKFSFDGSVGIGTSSPGVKLHIHDTNPLLKFSGHATDDDRIMGVDVYGFVIYNSEEFRYDMVIDDDGKVGIGTPTPSELVHIRKSASGQGTPDSNADLVIESSVNTGINFLTANNANARLSFGDPQDSDVGRLIYSHVDNSFRFRTAAVERVVFDGTGNVGIGTTAPTSDLSFGAATATISTDTSDGSDTKALVLTGGGAQGPGRGASIALLGSDFAASPGGVGILSSENADILINPGTGNVGISTATPTINLDVNAKSGMSAIGGFCVKLTNTTGVNTIQGQTIKADPDTNDAVILTAADDNECMGVFLESGIADDAEAWVVVAGIADVAMGDNELAARGNWVETNSGEAGYADATSATPAAAPQHFNEIGHCIESVAAGGEGTHILARCVLHFN